MTQADTVGAFLRRRLEETDRSVEELAEAAQVPLPYMRELLDGTRRPPLPAHSDIYDKLSRLLKLGRNQLAALAAAERAATAGAPAPPDAAVLRRLWEFCEPETRTHLQRRRRRDESAELADLVQRLLDVTKSAVRRTLNDGVALRASARRLGDPYVTVRLRLLEFLDATPDTLTPGDVEEFIRPRVSLWEIDSETGALRVVMHS